MFSGLRKLGESQDMADDITQDIDEGGDIDLITTNYMSPDSGYPSQRISNYDTQLVQHQTLNGVGQSRIAAPFLRNFLTKALEPQARTPYGTPRGNGGSETLTPRTAPSRGWGQTLTRETLMALHKPQPAPQTRGAWGRIPTMLELAKLRKPAGATFGEAMRAKAGGYFGIAPFRATAR